VLRQVNGFRGNTIRAGDYLMIPTATQSLTAYAQSADERAARQQNAPRSGDRRTHVVQSGESLWSISQKYGVGLRNLASWNAMAPGDTLSVGRELVIWTKAPAAAAAGAAAGAATAPPTTPVTTTAQASVVSSSTAAGFVATNRMREITYVVRRGDSLSSIAQRFRISVDKLVEWNAGAAAKYLQPGQRLKMVVDITAQTG